MYTWQQISRTLDAQARAALYAGISRRAYEKGFSTSAVISGQETSAKYYAEARRRMYIDPPSTLGE